MSNFAVPKTLSITIPTSRKRSRAIWNSPNADLYSGIAAFNWRLAQRPKGDTVKDTFISSQPDVSPTSNILSEDSDSTPSTVLTSTPILNDLEERLYKIETTVANLTQQFQELSEKLELYLVKASGAI